jgi:dTDP-4-amino-4,6-dideoxygalactose transaminase
MPGPGLQLIGDEELEQLIDVIRSGYFSRYRFADDGTAVEPSKVFLFEQEFAAALGARHAIGMNSCTSALLAGLSALDLGPGDEVIVPGYTFIASIAAVAYARSTPIFAEIDESLCLDPEDVERKITPRTRAILVVHMQGACGDLGAILDVARRHGLRVVEDVAQAGGGSWQGKALGTLGDVGAFSLNVFKVITAGDGGVLVTGDSDLYERAFAFHDHGAKPLRLGVADQDSLLGLNFRMHELTGAVALAQVRRLPGILEALRRRKRIFQECIADLPGIRFRPLSDPEGDCATTLTLLFDSAGQAQAMAAALGTKTLIQSGKHYYGNMPQILNRRMPGSAACPFTCPGHPSTADYRPGMLPRTDDVLSRSISLSIGVRDSYLGTDFGVDILTSEDDVRARAEEFRRRTAGVSIR